MNRAGRPIWAVDIPSGVHAGTGAILGCAVRAERTVTFALPKLGHILSPGAEHCGRLVVVDIGIPAELLAAAPGVELIDLAAVVPLMKKRDRNAHKGHFGHCLVVAGSIGKTGAAAMAANSAVRSGAGLVTVAVPASLNTIMEIKTTEAMTLPIVDNGTGCFAEKALEQLLTAAEAKSAIAIGPGIANHPATAALVRTLVPRLSPPLVVDADGLNTLADDISLLKAATSRALVLTPHPGEMARLIGATVAAVEADRIGVASSFAAEFGVYLVLKGSHTIIADPDGQVAINTSGNPGMASGGMGDVLTGLLTALLAQGYDPAAACRLGVYVHGLAADQVAERKGEMGMSAVDVQEQLPFTFKYIAEY
jgi:NAD(P)H-hydrate epimerase